MESAMNMFYFLIKCDSSILNMFCPTFLLGGGGLHLFMVGFMSPNKTIRRILATNYKLCGILSLVSVAGEVNGCWKWCENASARCRGAHLQRIICQSTCVETADCSCAGGDLSHRCITRALSIMVGYALSGAACLNFDLLQKKTDGRFLAQKLEDQVACSFCNSHSDTFMMFVAPYLHHTVSF